MTFLINVFKVVFLLGFLIFIHESGHFIVAKLCKVRVNEFAIGFGPKLFKRTKKNGEVFSVRALPLGGFCAFHGEDEDNQDKDAFNNKPAWQRIIVLISGALMNYLLAVL